MKDRKPFGYPPPAIRRDQDSSIRRSTRVPAAPPRERRVQVADPTLETDITRTFDDLLKQAKELLADMSPPGTTPSTAIPPLPPRREFGTRERLLETRGTWRTPDSQGTPKADEGILNVPMKCASTDRPFVLQFRKTGGLFGKAYRHEATVIEFDGLGDNASALSVPTNQMLWSNIKCPHCRALCRPIHCGRCQKLVCDARSSETGGRLYFQCSTSCGAKGFCGNDLTSIRGNAASGAPAQRLLASPAAIGQTLPKEST
jgi:hypothetical protein